MRRTTDLTSVERARATVLGSTPPPESEPVQLSDALGRVLAQPVSAKAPVPGFDNSAMDGYAVRSEDTQPDGAGGAELRVVGESRAGHPVDRTVGAGEAVAISTGAMMPAGADAVVMVEHTSPGADGSVRIDEPVVAGQNVRRAGEDIVGGAVVLEPGTRIGAAELGVAASVGCDRLSCSVRPRVSVLVTGDELRPPTEGLGPGEIHDSNAYAVPALAQAAGAEVVSVTHAGDDRDATRQALGSALEMADVVAVCGGVSVGPHDHVKGALESCGVEEQFWGVALKPGKPTWFGRPASGAPLVFGLPGNPVSAMVTFTLLARPALLSMQGLDPGARTVEAALTDDYAKQPGRAHAVRCRLEAGERGWIATPAPSQGSHVLTSMLGADGLALIPASAGDQPAGTRVLVELIGN